MHIEYFRDYCLAKPAVSETFPFGTDVLVLKVKDKMFALANLSGEFRINLKCDPEKAMLLREHYPDVLPGYHMNKKHWNTVLVTGSIPDKLIEEWTDDSYNLVVAKLTKKQQAELKIHNL